MAASSLLTIDKSYRQEGDEFKIINDFKTNKINYQELGIQYTTLTNDKYIRFSYQSANGVSSIITDEGISNNISNWGRISKIYQKDSLNRYVSIKNFRPITINFKKILINLVCVEPDNCDYYVITFKQNLTSNAVTSYIIDSATAANFN